LSPQSRRGRAQQASRKPKSRTEAAPTPEKIVEPVPAQEPAETARHSEPEAPRHSEGKRTRVAPVRKKRQHGTAYRWVSAYLPIMAGLFALLAGLWIYTSFINPPAPTPAEQWTKIQDKWSPAREAARKQIADPTLDFAAQQAAYKTFYDQTKGWVDEVTTPVRDWGAAGVDMPAFLSDGADLVKALQPVTEAKTVYDIANLAATIGPLDQNFTQDIVVIENDLKITVGATAPPLAFPSVNPTPTPTPSPSSAASASAGATASPAASSTPTPVPTPTPAAS
jgi:hypothetical protein